MQRTSSEHSLLTRVLLDNIYYSPSRHECQKDEASGTKLESQFILSVFLTLRLREFDSLKFGMG